MIYPTKAPTSETLATHYETLDPYYRKLWGEFINHGYWKKGDETVQTALEQLIELISEKGKIQTNTSVLDIGCGYGASARYLARKKGAQITALTLSKSQWQYSRIHDPESTNPRYILADFLKNSLSSNSFDVAVAIESLEEMTDKNLFFTEASRILRPGGRLVATAWIVNETPTKWETKHLLSPICQERHFPSIGTQNEYRAMIEKAGFGELHFQDITDAVQKTWSICAYRLTIAIFTDKKVRALLRNKKIPDRIFAITIYRIWLAFKIKSIRYGIFSAVK
ncbi:MAG: class I SAM-dependent methyltransferase [Verrucomicrobia bacterium]|nr:class I SAM-dependent methyltransferase [Verrucomicrobiota bacterium]